jgi:hypothetical protein
VFWENLAALILLTVLVPGYWLGVFRAPVRRWYVRIAQRAASLAQVPGAAVGALVLAGCAAGAALSTYGMMVRPWAWVVWLCAIPALCAVGVMFAWKHLAAGLAWVMSLTTRVAAAVIRQRWMWAAALLALAVLGVMLGWRVLGSQWFPNYHQP